jgi:hypothetical protein
MCSRISIAIGFAVALGSMGQAQELQRRAVIVGGGGRDRGQCTVEVLVDGQAQVEIRGDNLTLRNIKGQMPQLRRFECTAPMPRAAADFRFAAISGRGKQGLIGDPRNGGVAVVRIDDPQGGAGVYRFSIQWSGAFGDDRGGRGRPPFGPDDARRACEDAVRQQASRQFNPRDIAFRSAPGRGNPGPGDMVSGIFDVRRRDGRSDAYRYSCSVDFRQGRVFNASFMPMRN